MKTFTTMNINIDDIGIIDEVNNPFGITKMTGLVKLAV